MSSGHLQPTSSTILYDTDLHIPFSTSLQLYRTVECWQWYEQIRIERIINDSTGQIELRNVYHYTPMWSSQMIPSNTFHDRTYVNPTHWKLSSQHWSMDGMKIGSYTIPLKQMKQFNHCMILHPVTQQQLNDSTSEYQALIKHDGIYLFIGEKKETPQVTIKSEY